MCFMLLLSSPVLAPRKRGFSPALSIACDADFISKS